MSRAQNYRLLARYYDQFFTFHQYGYHLARKELLGSILPQVSSACDLACGTGTTAVELALMGIQVFALDFSSTMCRLTREKAAKAGVALRVIRGDMRSFKLPEQVDLITCEFDALNHVPRRTDLDRVAAAAARALRPGGVFCFDVNNRMAFEKLWPGTWRSEGPGVVLIMWGGYDRARDCGWDRGRVVCAIGRPVAKIPGARRTGVLELTRNPSEPSRSGLQSGSGSGRNALFSGRMESAARMPDLLPG